jgi:dienelactone hydrolase
MKLRQKSRVAIFAVIVVVVLLFRPARAHVRAATLLDQFAAADRSAPFAVDEARSEIASARGAIKVRTFTPRDRIGAPGLLMVHGVHRLGIDEPRLMRFARAIAASGVSVMTPEIAELADYRVDARSIDTIGDAAHALRARCGGPVGVMGMSFAGGLSLLAAADPRFASDVRFVVAVGAHDDLGRVSRFFATNTIARPDGSTLGMQAHPYGPLVLVYSHVEDFFPSDDVPVARDALRLWLWEERESARARASALSPVAKQKMDRLFGDHVDAIAQELLTEIAKNEALMAPVSPHGRLGSIRVPVFLLHGAGDSVIPPTETLWLAEDVPHGYVHDVLVSPALVHVELEGEPSLRDKWALVHFMAEVLEATAP